jgi:hypothetical protein
LRERGIDGRERTECRVNIRGGEETNPLPGRTHMSYMSHPEISQFQDVNRENI